MKIVIPENKSALPNVPKNYVLLSDSSGSMYGAVDELKKTIVAVSKLMKPNDTITIGDFSSYGDYDFFVRGSTISDKNLENLINKKIRARGLTCYTQSLGDVKKIVEDVRTITGNNNFSFYFLSDGYPNDRSPESEIFRICSELKGLFVEATIVGYGSYYGRETLIGMATKIGGKFNHVNDYKEMERSYEEFFKAGVVAKKNIKIDKKYDLVWQVSGDIIILEQNSNKSVDVIESDGKNDLYAINYDELDGLTPKDLTDPSFVYSLAYVLSQQNKANLGVALLRKVGDEAHSKTLRKAFTVSQKGKAENILKYEALHATKVVTTKAFATVALKDFVGEIAENLGKVQLDLGKSKYNKISRKGIDVSNVEFKTIDEHATIIGITGNENRPNISFLTVRKGQITKVNDKELFDKIEAYNTVHKNSKIEFPFVADTYRNYTLVANGDFNYDVLTLIRNGKEETIHPEKDIDIFDEDVKSVKLKDFTNLYKTLIVEKAHASVLRFYIKNNTDTVQADDLRLKKYGVEGKELLYEMGLDYQLRYAPKIEGKLKDENADYIPFTEISAALKGSSKISAKDSYEKYLKSIDPKVTKEPKKNPGDEICWPLFAKYDKLLKDLGKETFVETIQSTLKGIEKTTDLLSGKLATLKFYLITTNSWFEGETKTDTIETDGLVIKVEETKEYL